MFLVHEAYDHLGEWGQEGDAGHFFFESSFLSLHPIPVHLFPRVHSCWWH